MHKLKKGAKSTHLTVRLTFRTRPSADLLFCGPIDSEDVRRHSVGPSVGQCSEPQEDQHGPEGRGLQVR